MPDREALYTISPSSDSTLAIEIWKTGLQRKKKHVLFFEQFSGTLHYSQDEPEKSTVAILIGARSVVCRDNWLKEKKQRQVTNYARQEGLAADRHPDIRFSSRQIRPKALRGFVVEGDLNLRGISRVVQVNVVLNPRKHDTIQIDGDATIRLSDFGMNLPSSLFGLIGTKDEALIRILLWATPAG